MKKVLVIGDAAAISIDGLGFELKAGPHGSRQKAEFGKKLVIRADGKNLIANGKDVGPSLVVTSRERQYGLGDRTFGGELYIYSKPPGSMIIVNKIPLEKYLVGIVGSEISPTWPIESIKAQVVAARTYAMNKMEAPSASVPKRLYDVTSTVSSQVYHGSHVEDARSAAAVRETSGEVLMKDGKIFPAYYHSCCGGKTENAHNVWDGETGPPLVEDSFCARSPAFRWRYSISERDFVKRLSDSGFSIARVQSVATTILSDSPRVQFLLVEDGSGLQMIDARDLRKIFGHTNIKSTWFEVRIVKGSLEFSGKGYGHGVGMCQWGVKGMADEGRGYRDILKFYYSDAEIKRAY